MRMFRSIFLVTLGWCRVDGSAAFTLPTIPVTVVTTDESAGQGAGFIAKSRGVALGALLNNHHAVPPSIEKPSALERMQSADWQSVDTFVKRVAVGAGSTYLFVAENEKKKNSKDRIKFPRRKTLEELKIARDKRLEKIEILKELQAEMEEQMNKAPARDFLSNNENAKKSREVKRTDEEKQASAKKYASIESLEERAYQILMDLGMAKEHRIMNLELATNILAYLEKEMEIH